ncbi:MAG: hypothetical protein FWB73_04725 [Treponema sp.]|nr:hypothetical protein [Treponema sp.]
MTYSEKSKKISNNKPAAADGDYTFSEVVDRACEELQECQMKYSIRRIQEMEDFLACLERELDDFLKLRVKS